MEHLTAEQLRRAGKGILLGTVVAPLGGALLTILFAALLSVGIPDATIPLFAHLTILLGAALGGFFGGRRSKTLGLPVGAAVGLGLFCLQLIVILCTGNLSAGCLTYLAAAVLGGSLGGICAVNL